MVRSMAKHPYIIELQKKLDANVPLEQAQKETAQAYFESHKVSTEAAQEFTKPEVLGTTLEAVLQFDMMYGVTSPGGQSNSPNISTNQDTEGVNFPTEQNAPLVVNNILKHSYKHYKGRNPNGSDQVARDMAYESLESNGWKKDVKGKWVQTLPIKKQYYEIDGLESLFFEEEGMADDSDKKKDAFKKAFVAGMKKHGNKAKASKEGKMAADACTKDDEDDDDIENYNASLAMILNLDSDAPKLIQIGKVGRFGEKEVTEKMLDEVVKNFDSRTTKPRLTNGHPRTDGGWYDPFAYGLFDKVIRKDKDFFGQVKSINPKMKQWVNEGLLLDRSMGLAKDDKGWYLNHVAMLGAKHPAIEGMPAFNFEKEYGHKPTNYEVLFMDAPPKSQKGETTAMNILELSKEQKDALYLEWEEKFKGTHGDPAKLKADLEKAEGTISNFNKNQQKSAIKTFIADKVKDGIILPMHSESWQTFLFCLSEAPAEITMDFEKKGADGKKETEKLSMYDAACRILNTTPKNTVIHLEKKSTIPADKRGGALVTEKEDGQQYAKGPDGKEYLLCGDDRDQIVFTAFEIMKTQNMAYGTACVEAVKQLNMAA